MKITCAILVLLLCAFNSTSYCCVLSVRPLMKPPSVSLMLRCANSSLVKTYVEFELCKKLVVANSVTERGSAKRIKLPNWLMPIMSQMTTRMSSSNIQSYLDWGSCDGNASSKLWSLWLWMQFMQLRMEAWKIQDFNLMYQSHISLIMVMFKKELIRATSFLFWFITSGLKIAANTVAFATKFFPLATKISVEVTDLRLSLIFTSALSKQKGYQMPICCYFNKIKKEITKLFCFLPWIFFQSEDTLIVAYNLAVMLLLSNMPLNTGTVAFFWAFTILSGFFMHKYCRLVFCFAKRLTRKCSPKILRLKVAKLWLNFGILLQNCDWIFLLISSPVTFNSFKCKLWIWILWCFSNMGLTRKCCIH